MRTAITRATLVVALILSLMCFLKLRELAQLQKETQVYWEELTYEHQLLQRFEHYNERCTRTKKLQKMEEELNLEVNAICGN